MEACQGQRVLGIGRRLFVEGCRNMECSPNCRAPEKIQKGWPIVVVALVMNQSQKWWIEVELPRPLTCASVLHPRGQQQRHVYMYVCMICISFRNHSLYISIHTYVCKYITIARLIARVALEFRNLFCLNNTCLFTLLPVLIVLDFQNSFFEFQSSDTPLAFP